MSSLCNLCSQTASKRCSACQIVNYCSAECQRKDWKDHKPNCFKKVETIKPIDDKSKMANTIKVCIVDGDKAIDSTISTIDNNLSDRKIWYKCKAPTLIGIPLVVKRLGPSPQERKREVSVFLMIETSDGLAPMPWQSNAHQKLGRLMFARTDGVDFDCEMFWSLYSYIFHLMDYYGNGQDEYVANTMFTADEFYKYKSEEDKIQADYQTFLNTTNFQ